MFLGLRKVDGVDKKHFKQKFGQDLDATFANAIQKQPQKAGSKITKKMWHLQEVEDF